MAVFSRKTCRRPFRPRCQPESAAFAKPKNRATQSDPPDDCSAPGQCSADRSLLTTFNEVDMSEVKKLREQYRDSFEKKYGIKLGFMSFSWRELWSAVAAVPGLNAQMSGKSLVYHNYCDIGIAVGGGKGLVVPVLRNAETMSFAEIEQALEYSDRRPKTISSRWKSLKAEHSRSPTAEFMAPCCRLRSSIHLRVVCLECTGSLIDRWR